MIEFPKISPAPGVFLIAGANMLDPNFSRSVILLCEHRYEGSFGLILNQPLRLKLADVLTNMTDRSEKIYRGGPVQENTLHFIHRCPGLGIGSKKIMPNVYWGGDLGSLAKKFSEDKISSKDIRFFVGYSGWGEGQLDDEIKKDAWYLRKATSEMIFYADSRNHWRNIFKIMGKEYAILSNFPDDPRLN